MRMTGGSARRVVVRATSDGRALPAIAVGGTRQRRVDADDIV